MSNPMRKKAKSIGPREVYVVDDVWKIIKQYVVDYRYTHRTKMVSVVSELSHLFNSHEWEYFYRQLEWKSLMKYNRPLDD